MQPLAYAAILAVIAPLTVMTWFAFTGDRAGLRNIQANLGKTSKAKGPALSTNEKLTLVSQRKIMLFLSILIGIRQRKYFLMLLIDFLKINYQHGLQLTKR